MPALSDETLAQKATQDIACFEILMRRYEDKLIRYVQRISALSDMESEEVVQEAFLKIWKNLNDFDPSLKFSSWAYRITHNQTISIWRKHTAQGTKTHIYLEPEMIDQIADEFDFVTEVEAKFTAKRVQNILEQLPEKYRSVLILKYLEDRSYDEIADILQKPPGTVATLLSRAKAQFKTLYLKPQAPKSLNNES